MLFGMRFVQVGRWAGRVIALILAVLLVLPFAVVRPDRAEAWVTIQQDNPSWNPVSQILTGINMVSPGTYWFSELCTGPNGNGSPSVSNLSTGFGTAWGDIINSSALIYFDPYLTDPEANEGVDYGSGTYVHYGTYSWPGISGTIQYIVVGHYTDGSSYQTSYTYSVNGNTIGAIVGGASIYLGQQQLTVPQFNASGQLSWLGVQVVSTINGMVGSWSSTQQDNLGYLNANVWATYAEGNDAADEPTAQGAEFAAQAAQSAANTAATDAQGAQSAAQGAQSAAQGAQSAAQAAQNNTWYNSNSAGYWAYQSYQKAQAAAMGPLSIQVTGQNGADAISASSMELYVAVTGGTGPYQYSVNGGGFSPLPNTGCIFVPISQGANQEKVTVKDANGEVANAAVTIWGLP